MFTFGITVSCKLASPQKKSGRITGHCSTMNSNLKHYKYLKSSPARIPDHQIAAKSKMMSDKNIKHGLVIT